MDELGGNDENEDDLERNFTRAIILALNTCYHVGLQNEESRLKFRNSIAPIFKSQSIDANFISDEINLCYEVFLDEIQLPDAIARNQVTRRKNKTYLQIIR